MAAPMSPDNGDDESVFEQELELLQEIYIHEINIKKNNGHPCELSLVLHPATADRTDLQFVTLTLIFQITKEYPDVLPEIIIRNPRGLSEREINSLQNKLKECAASKVGEAMLFELIEIAKESLTANNTPSCECVICCHTFEDDEAFTKTECYHYFHNNCLVRYLKYAKENEEKAVCPVCRELLEDLGNLSDRESLTDDLPQFIVDPALRDWQKKMAALRTKQARKGGIIDVVANSNKFLLDISSTPTVAVVSVPTEPAESKGQCEKKDTEDSSSQKVKGHPEGKSDSGKPGRVRRTHTRENQYHPHSADDRRDRKTEFKSGGERRTGFSRNFRGRYNQRSGQLEDNRRKANSSHYTTTQRSGRLASKPTVPTSNKSGAVIIPQRNTTARRDAEKVVKKPDVVESKVNGDKDEDIAAEGKIVDKETAKKEGGKSDKEIAEVEDELGDCVISSRVQSEETSQDRKEQKRSKQSGYCHEKKEGDRNNVRRGHVSRSWGSGSRGRGSGNRGRGNIHNNPSRLSSANISRRNYRTPGWKKENDREEVRAKSQTKDVLSDVVGQRSTESQEKDKGYKVKTQEQSPLNPSVEGTDKLKLESGRDIRSKTAPPGFHGNSKVNPPPGFEDFR